MISLPTAISIAVIALVTGVNLGIALKKHQITPHLDYERNQKETWHQAYIQLLDKYIRLIGAIPYDHFNEIVRKANALPRYPGVEGNDIKESRSYE